MSILKTVLGKENASHIELEVPLGPVHEVEIIRESMKSE